MCVQHNEVSVFDLNVLDTFFSELFCKYNPDL